MILGLQCLVLVVAHLTKVKAYSLPYASNGPCRNNTTEYLVDNSRCCSRCKPGTRLSSSCTVTVDTACVPCQQGTYSGTFNYHPNCFSCTKCQERKNLIYGQECTRVSNAVCVCKAGWHCTFPISKTHCDQCKKNRICLPGTGNSSPGPNVNCAPCPEGTFSNETNVLPCRSHTRCDIQGRCVLRPGTSEYDTICDATATICDTTLPVPSPSDPPMTLRVNPSISKFPVHNMTAYWIGFGTVAAVILLGSLMMAFIVCHRKDETEPATEDETQVLDKTLEKTHTDASLASTLSDSHSHTESSPGWSTGTAPDCSQPEPTTLPSPCVNVSITATFNCQVNPSNGSCSIPVGQPAQTAQQAAPPTELPFSQEEELCSSCQQEESKGPSWSAQESGKTTY